MLQGRACLSMKICVNWKALSVAGSLPQTCLKSFVAVLTWKLCRELESGVIGEKIHWKSKNVYPQQTGLLSYEIYCDRICFFFFLFFLYRRVFKRRFKGQKSSDEEWTCLQMFCSPSKLCSTFAQLSILDIFSLGGKLNVFYWTRRF